MKPRLLSEFYAMLMHLWPYELSQLRAVVKPAREGVLGLMSTGRRVTVQVEIVFAPPYVGGADVCCEAGVLANYRSATARVSSRRKLEWSVTAAFWALELGTPAKTAAWLDGDPKVPSHTPCELLPRSLPPGPSIIPLENVCVAFSVIIDYDAGKNRRTVADRTAVASQFHAPGREVFAG